MEESTKAFIKKIKLNTYIYTLTFIIVGILYTVKHEISLGGVEVVEAALINAGVLANLLHANGVVTASVD